MIYKSRESELNGMAEIFKALAHPSRLFIVEQLLQQERCVRELTQMIGVEMPTISKHLSVLKHAGIIIARKDRNNIFYRIKCECIRNMLSCTEHIR